MVVTRSKIESKVGWILDTIMMVGYNSWCSEFLKRNQPMHNGTFVAVCMYRGDSY